MHTRDFPSRFVTLWLVLALLFAPLAHAVHAAQAPSSAQETFQRMFELLDAKGRFELLNAFQRYQGETGSTGSRIVKDLLAAAIGTAIGVFFLADAPVIAAGVLVFGIAAVAVAIAEGWHSSNNAAARDRFYASAAAIGEKQTRPPAAPERNDPAAADEELPGRTARR